MKAAAMLIVPAMLLVAWGCGSQPPGEPSAAGGAKPTSVNGKEPSTSPAPAPLPPTVASASPLSPIAPPPAPPPLTQVSWIPAPPPPPPPGSPVEREKRTYLSGEQAHQEMIKRVQIIAKTDVQLDGDTRTVRIDYQDGSHSFKRIGRTGHEYEFHPAK